MKYKIVLFFAAAFLLYHITASGFLGNLLSAWDEPTTEASAPYVDPYADVPRHNYDWDNLTSNGGRMEYTVPKGFTPVQGVDVSRYQGAIDWSVVSLSGIDFAMLRVGYRGYTEGMLYKDEKFLQNIEQAANADLDVGVYFFSQAITVAEAIEEANFVLDLIGGYAVNYPIVFDLEEISAADHRTFGLTQEERTNIALAFCDTISAAGHKPMIYGNASWLTDCYDLTKIMDYDLWLAQYSDEPTFPYDFKMWQYTDQGYVDGIDHVVDLNLCFVPYGN